MNHHPLDHRIPPPVLLVVAFAAMWAAAAWLPVLSLPGALRFTLTAALALGGAAINVAGFRTIRGAGSTIDPTRPSAATALVTSGPFRISRNPMYVGFATLLLAWAVYLQSAWALVGPLLYVLYLQRFQITPEERALRARFGSEFEAYATRVRRWL